MSTVQIPIHQVGGALVYLAEDRFILETPGLRDIEIASARAGDVRVFFEELGFVPDGEALSTASGQQLIVRQARKHTQLRILFAPGDDPTQFDQWGNAVREGWSGQDPDGYAWGVWGGTG